MIVSQLPLVSTHTDLLLKEDSDRFLHDADSEFELNGRKRRIKPYRSLQYWRRLDERSFREILLVDGHLVVCFRQIEKRETAIRVGGRVSLGRK